MKLEKNVLIGDINYHNLYIDNEVYRRGVSFSILSNEISDEELILLKKMQENYEVKLTLEIEKPILDNAEKKYLSEVIRPFRDRVDCIQKNILSQREFISIALNGEIIVFPFFQKGAMYKGMQLNKEYTLKELGL